VKEKRIMKDLWTVKGATLSDTSAKKEYGLTSEEIIEAVRKGSLQYKEGNMHGNPWLRLLRCEVEKLVVDLRGKEYIVNKKIQNEIKEIDKTMRKLKKEIDRFEKRKFELLGRCMKN
jgi:hypothetical protein